MAWTCLFLSQSFDLRIDGTDFVILTSCSSVDVKFGYKSSTLSTLREAEIKRFYYLAERVTLLYIFPMSNS